MLRSLGACPRENFEMIDAFWCVLMHILIRIRLKKVTLFNSKNVKIMKQTCCK